MSFSFYDIIGLCGPALFVSAYYMVSTCKWSGRMMRFHLFNFVGAIAMLISLLHNWNLPTVLLEICWITISVVGMVKARRASV